MRPLSATLFAVLLLLGGCAAPVREPLAGITVLERAPSLDPATLPDADVLALDTNAREFIARHTSGVADAHAKLRALRSAVFDADKLGFAYDPTLTLTASETIARATGNCLSLANFFVAAVRHIGIDAHYQEIRRDGARASTELRILETHVNVSGVLPERGRYVIDFLAVPEQDFRLAVPVTDRHAMAQYHNNLAMEQLEQGNIEEALVRMKKAILVEARAAFLWSNLGVIYARRGDDEAAESAYLRAVALDEEQVSAMKNLLILYQRTGRTADAERYRRRLSRQRDTD